MINYNSKQQFTLGAAFICVILFVTALYQPQSSRIIHELWDGTMHWAKPSFATIADVMTVNNNTTPGLGLNRNVIFLGDSTFSDLAIDVSLELVMRTERVDRVTYDDFIYKCSRFPNPGKAYNNSMLKVESNSLAIGNNNWTFIFRNRCFTFESKKWTFYHHFTGCPQYRGDNCGAKSLVKTLKIPRIMNEIQKANDILFNYAEHECLSYLKHHTKEEYSRALELALARVIELKSDESRLFYVSSNNYMRSCIGEVDAVAKDICARLEIKYIDISKTISHWEKINGNPHERTHFGAINIYVGKSRNYTDLTLMHNITHFIIEKLEL